jgi:hypothetical protein
MPPSLAISVNSEVESGGESDVATFFLAHIRFLYTVQPIKDNICTRDLPTTCASRILDKFTSPFNATVVDQLTWVSLAISVNSEVESGGESDVATFFLAHIRFLYTKCPCCAKLRDASLINMHMVSMPS